MAEVLSLSNSDERSVAGPIEVRVWIRLLANANIVLRHLRRTLHGEFGVTMPAFDLLAQVSRPPEGPTMSELSQRLMVSKGNVTDLVERMEGKGLVQRHPDPGDGRVQHVHLTPAGRALLARMLPVHRRCLEGLMAGMDEATMGQLHHILGTLKTTLAANTAITKRPHGALRSQPPVQEQEQIP
ncbi:MAG: MarR family transcriptional regulator [Rhodospirillales bacterium]|nr:MarR family transcriptional regulator [Rhodospirillales bacterium]